jgi:hypothetical protein
MIEYQDSNFSISLVELTMEFYIKVIQMLVKLGHALFNILSGKKAIHIRQIRLNSSSHVFQLVVFILST